jgi:hypothetical protein
VTGQPLLLTIAGLSLSVAGFAGLMTAFRRGEGWSATDIWRMRGIVRLSFINMFLALVPAALFLVVPTDQFALGAGSLPVASVYALEALGVMRERARSGLARWIVGYLAMDAVLGVAMLANVVLASSGSLAIVLLIRLAHPVGLFTEAIRSFEPTVPPEVERPSAAEVQTLLTTAAARAPEATKREHETAT